MPDLRDELEKALSPRFSIIRELGGGGMSRVFLARETELDREVVIKVLPPETAGLNLARFRRETQMAAKLHHPHIVPLHTSGDAAGVLYYTMPFVQGETLRARIASEKKLPVAEVVRVLRDVADALAFAHNHQLVHRDIKPENVLLSNGHALVTDFGIAKAIAVAEVPESQADSRTHATASGLAIGTPAYMAPEQAAGDPKTDHRADIYALGLLGYEMLSGRSPFASSSNPHEMIAAHIAERPRPIGELRPDTPLLLADLVMRCLEKRPEDRPASAAAVREQLDAMRTPSGGISAATWAARRTPRRIAMIGIMGISAIAIAIAVQRAESKPTLDRNVVAVAPFQVSSASLGYLREGMLDLFAAKLTGEGGPRAASPRTVLSAWRRAAGSDTTDLPRDAALDVAEDIGSGQLLLGEISGTTDSLVISATLLDVQDGRLRASARVFGRADSLPQLIDGVTAQLLAMGAGERARLSAMTTSSLPALRAYLAGQWLFRKARYKAASDEFKKALAADSGFAVAAIASMEASEWIGDMPQYAKAGAIAWKHRDKLSQRDRALLNAQLGPRYPQPSSYTETIAATAAYRDIAPDRADAWFHYGDALVHHGPFIGNTAAFGQAELALSKAVELDSSYAPALEHLVLLAARRGDAQATKRYADLFFAADTGAESARGVRWRVAVATGDLKSADSIISQLDPLPPTSNSIATWVALEDGIMVPKAYELLRRIGEREVSQGFYSAYMMMHDAALMVGRPKEARLALEHFEKEVQPAPKERLKEVLTADGDLATGDSAIRMIRAEWAQPRPAKGPALGSWAGTQCLAPLYLLLARNDTTGARASVAALSALARDSMPLSGYAASCAALVDGALAVRSNAPDARVRVARADSVMKSGPSNPTQEFGNPIVAKLWEGVGEPRLALDAIRRRSWFLGRKMHFGTSLREEGRLAAATGDTEGAIRAYSHYLRLREPAEPEMNAELESVRQELKRLERASAGR
ncbi:MAG TPA: serine/threonine-protein kinase [Gemmatimonadaceae bacterium]|nr:serine/threonine-protein kinase [Gemmatimonadaceae bacterium]